jgi:hypothetical protein
LAARKVLPGKQGSLTSQPYCFLFVPQIESVYFQRKNYRLIQYGAAFESRVPKMKQLSIPKIYDTIGFLLDMPEVNDALDFLLEEGDP